MTTRKFSTFKQKPTEQHNFALKNHFRKVRIILRTSVRYQIVIILWLLSVSVSRFPYRFWGHMLRRGGPHNFFIGSPKNWYIGVFRGAEHWSDIYFAKWGILTKIWGTFTKIYQVKIYVEFFNLKLFLAIFAIFYYAKKRLISSKE